MSTATAPKHEIKETKDAPSVVVTTPMTMVSSQPPPLPSQSLPTTDDSQTAAHSPVILDESKCSSRVAALATVVRGGAIVNLIDVVDMSVSEWKDVETLLMTLPLVGTAVARHAGFFTTSDRKTFTHAHLKEAHGPLGLASTGVVAHAKATVIMQLAAATIPTTNTVTHTLPTICARTNPAASGFWGPDQNVSEQRWTEFSKQYLPNNQTYATKTNITNYLATLMMRLHGVDDDARPHKAVAGTGLKGILKVTWERVTKGSFDDLFTICVDHWVRDEENKTWIPAITLPTLRLFYDNFPVVAIRILAGQLPVPRPDVATPSLDSTITSTHGHNSKCIVM
jgi:hypothetical protein